jgi:PAP2 superfamily protein
MKAEQRAEAGSGSYTEDLAVGRDARGKRPSEALRVLAARLSISVSDEGARLLSAWALIVVLLIIDWSWARRAGLTFVGWRNVVPALGFLGSVGVFYSASGRNPRLADAGHYASLWVAFSVAGAVLTYLVATLRLPLRDAELARIDAVLGFDWFGWSRFIATHRLLKLPLAIAYATFLPQIIGSVIWFSHIQRSDRNSELLRMAMPSLLITAVISAIIPAVGPYFPGRQPDWSLALLAIRDGTASSFALNDLKGIITLPSFHTVMAVLLVYAHRPPVRSFLPIATLNFLMLLATPAEGHHYLIDVITGAAVAALCIAVERSVARARRAASVPIA